MSFWGWPRRRGKYWIYRYSDSILYHWRDKPSKVGTWQSKAWIRIHLNQADFHILIDHVVITQNLKAVLTPLSIHLLISCSDRVGRNLFNLRKDFFKKVSILIFPRILDVSLEVVIREFIPALELSILLASLLHCIIS